MSFLFYLARHGETEDNARRIFQGQGGRGLNARGRAQAGRLAARLARQRLAAIVSSDLERAVETARIVGEACEIVPTVDRDLREVDVGTWTGRGYDEVRETHPEEYEAWAAGLDVRRGGGETYRELADRVERAIARHHAAAVDGERLPILLVSHGGSIRSWVARILGAGGEGLSVLGGVGNTSLTFVERDHHGGHRLHSWNDTAHLEGLLVDEQTD